MGGRGRRAAAKVGLGTAFVLAGIGVLVYASQLSAWLLGILGSTAGGTGDSSNVTGLGAPTLAAYIPFVIFGLGFTLLGIGGNFFRSLVMAPALGLGMGGSSAAPEEVLARVEAQMARQGTPPSSLAGETAAGLGAPSKPIVRVKCRSCGFLEREDAVYCSSCGKPI